MQIAFGRVRRKTSPAERWKGLVLSGAVPNRAYFFGGPRLLFWRTAPTFLEDHVYRVWLLAFSWVSRSFYPTYVLITDD